MSFLLITVSTFVWTTLTIRAAESRGGLVPYEFRGEDIPICSFASCKGRCGTMTTKYCSCDQLCMTFRDCCYDYGQHCTRDAQPAPEVPEYNTDQGFSNLQTWTSEIQPIVDQLTCVKYPNPEKFNDYLNVLTVASCPSNAAETNQTDNCLTMSNDYRINTPLLYKENMLIYRNLACLECNVMNIETEKVVYAEPNYRCENATVVMHAVDLAQNDDILQAYNVLIKENCLLRYLFTHSIYPALGPSLAQHFRDCGSTSACNQSNFNGTKTDFLDAQHYCNLYLSPIESYEKEQYKNAHCAYCNGISMDNIKGCRFYRGRPSFDFMPSLTLLLNVRDEDNSIPRMVMRGKPVCTNGRFLDVINQRCFEVCPDGLVSLGGICVDSNHVITAPNLTLPEFSMNQDYLFLLRTNSSINDLLNVTEEFMNDLTNDVLLKEMVEDCELKYPWLDISTSNITCVRIKTTHQWHSPFPVTYRNGYTVVPNKYMTGVMRTTTLPLEVEVFALQIDMFSNETISCPEMHMNAHVDYDILFSNGEHIESEAGLYVSKYGKLFENWREIEKRELPVGYQIQFNFESYSFEHNRLFAIFCKAKLAHCVTKTIANETAEVINGSLYDSLTGSVYGTGSFVHLKDHQFLVCTNKSRDMTYQRSVTKSGISVEATVQGILTLLCNIISPFFLFVTIISYCLLKPLRTLPGIGIMNLSISLLFAQILFQIGHSLRPWPLLCYITAFVQHYFWLVTFMWTNTLAYLSYRIFTNCTTGQQVKASRIIKLLVYAWGIPIAFVAVCIVIEMYQWLPFQYGNESSCWINGNEGRLYFFAIPLAVIIAINMILFVCTALAIKRTMQVAETANSTLQENRNRFIIYIKLSTVMGFTWLFGFLANVKMLNFLWYPFIIFNGLQGVFICVSFVMNGRVMKLYQELLRSKTKHGSSDQTNGSPVESASNSKTT